MKFSLFLTTWFVVIGICTNEVPNSTLESITENVGENRFQNESNIDYDDYDKISKLEFVKDTIMGNMTEIYEKVGHSKTVEIDIPKNKLPSFSDNFQVGNYTEGYFLGNIDVYNVGVNKLDNYSISKIEIDYKEGKATLKLQYDKIRIIGKYAIGSFLQGSNGDFVVELTSPVYIRTMNFEIDWQTDDIRVKFVDSYSTSKLEYNTIDSTYNDMSFITKIRKGAIDSKLVEDVIPKIRQHMNDTLNKNNYYQQLETLIKQYTPNESVKRQFMENISQIMKNLTDFRSNRRPIELKGEPFEISREVYVVKMAKMFVNGWESLDLTNLKILEDENRVAIITNINLIKTRISVHINVQHSKNSHIPFKMMNIVYEIDTINQTWTFTMEKQSGNAFVPTKMAIWVGEMRLVDEKNEYSDDAEVQKYLKNILPSVIHPHLINRMMGFTIAEIKLYAYAKYTINVYDNELVRKRPNWFPR